MAPLPVEYQAAAALYAVLRTLPDPDYWPDGMAVVEGKDHVGNVVMFTVNGVELRAAITTA